jgi:SAM-dependent methyltransferase
MFRKSRPGPGYVNPRAGRSNDHTFGLEVADSSSPNYHRWIAQLIRPHIGRRVLEIGAGYGDVSGVLSRGVADYVATDTAPECLTALESRFCDSPNITVRKLDVLADNPDGEFDSIVMINVLEHLRDDAGVLTSLSENLAADGRLIVYVPALNSLYGEWDDWIGHFRRYSKDQLERTMRAAGLVVVESRYINLLAIPAWFAFSRLGIRRKQGTKGSGIGRDLQLWDKTAVPITRLLESRVRPPIGLNVLGVARRDRRAP